METGNKPTTETVNRDADADLSLLLYKTGRSIKQFLLWIARGIGAAGRTLLAILLFLFRNILWLLIGFVIGLLFGIYQVSKTTTFSSDMIVKANFGSSRNLYNAVNYVNSLISANQVNELSTMFEITPAEAAQLHDLSIEPEISELITAEMYRQEFLEPERNKKMRLDTFWTRTVKYEDFKENLTDFDYPLYKITAKTSNATVFTKLGNGIAAYINSNPLLSAIKQQQAESNAGEEKLLVNSIGNLDSLRNAYNQRLIKGESTVPNGNQMMLLQGTKEQSIPELDLYDKMIELQDLLEKSRNRSATESNAVVIQAPFSPVGKKISTINRVSTLALYGFLLATAILLLIGFYKWLLAFEASHKTGKKPAKA
ncbi:MAG: hypothetical protein JNK79_10215 [Chitinophagaceae bacterium]|nr:hypothetical protein [Chitinophagaceae bacterium]